MTKLDWDRERRDRAAREKGTVRAGGHTGRAVPPSDKLVDRLVRLGYIGPRPGTAALARELIRIEQQPLKKLDRALDQLYGQPSHTWADELPRLWADLRTAYQREESDINASSAKARTKWDRELELTKERRRLEGRLRKMEKKLNEE